MDADIIVLSSDTESSTDIVTESSDGGDESELDGESDGTSLDSEIEAESDETYHEGGTEEESELEEIEVDPGSDIDEEMETENEVLEDEKRSDDDGVVMPEVAWPALPAAGDAVRWAPILEALCVPGLSYAPVIMPTVHHVCSQCCLLFIHPWDLTRHMVTHVGQDSQACSHCLEKFKDALTLQLHTASEHQEKLETDIKVETDHERKAQWESDILADLKQIDEYTETTPEEEVEIPEQTGNSTKQEKLHSCFQCGRSYGTPWELTRHQIGHAGEPLNKCSHCGMYFPDPEQLVEHVKTHPEELSLQCVIEIEDEPQPELIEMMINKVKPVITKVKPVITKVKPVITKVKQVITKVKPVITKVKPVITKVKPESYQCAYCNEVCDNLIALKSHTKYFHKCPKCPKMLSNTAQRHVHMQTHEAEKPYKCGYCKTTGVKYFDSTQQLKNHIKNCHECSQCGKMIRDTFDFNQHMLSHEQDKLLKLMARAPTFKIDTSTKRHGCCQCEALFCCPYDLTRHMMSHVVPRCQSCPHCQQVFRDTANLEQHIAAIHSAYPHKAPSLHTPGLLAPKAEDEQMEGKVKMESAADLDIQREAEIQADLKQIDEYIETRTDVKVETKQEKKLHKCCQCRNRYGTPWDLTRHGISHIGQTLNTCPDCGMRLTDAASLQDHMETHVKQSFLCPHCAEEFTAEADFDAHIAAHAEDSGSDSGESGHEGLKEQSSVQKSYECTVCDAVFNHSEEYISHMMGHSKDKSKRDQSRHKSSTSRESGRYKETRANVVHSLQQSALGGTVQDEMIKHLPTIESVAPTEPTGSVTPNPDEFLSFTEGSIRLMKYGAQTLPPPTPSSSSLQGEQKRYLPQVPEGFSSSSSSQRGRNVQLVRPMMSSTVAPATLAHTPIPSTREQPAINPHVAHMYHPSTSSSSLATVNRSSTLRHNIGDLYSSTMISGQTEMDSSMMYPVIQPTMSSLPAVVSHTYASDHSLSAMQGNQYETNRNIQVIQPMSSFDDLVAALATNDSLSAAGRQHDMGRNTQVIQPSLSHLGNSSGFADLTEDTEKPHQCPICGQKFAVIWEVENHMASHAMPGFQACFICRRWFDTAVQLREHQATHREDMSKTSPGSRTEVQAPSRSSNVESRKRSSVDFTDNPHSLDDLIKHRRLYSDDNLSTMASNPAGLPIELPHVCYICGLGFSHPNTLRDHIYSHSAEVPQSCSVCQQWFSTTAGLLQHQMMHH